MADTAVQRLNMVDSQVRPSDVTDRRIVRAMLEVPREAFVPEAMRALAYSDGDVRLGAGDRALLAPRVFAKLVQLAAIEPGDRVLDVGSGSGYSAAVLSQLAGHVTALEADAGLADAAKQHFAAIPGANVEVVRGELNAGHAAAAPYDAIVVEGAVPQVPSALLDQLRDGGRLVAIVQSGGTSRALVLRRSGGGVGETQGFDATAPLLPGFARPAAFAL